MLVEHLFTTVLKQLDALLTLRHQIIHKDAEILVVVEQMKSIFVLGIDELQVLVSVRQDVQYERRRILQVHLRMLAHFDDLVHQFPRFFDRLLLDDELRGSNGASDRPLHPTEEALRLNIPLTTASSARHLCFTRSTRSNDQISPKEPHRANDVTLADIARLF